MIHKDAAREAVYELLEELRAAFGRPYASKQEILKCAEDRGAQIEAEKERCAKCCDESAEYWERMEREADTGRSAYAFALAAECLRRQAREIRGTKC